MREGPANDGGGGDEAGRAVPTPRGALLRVIAVFAGAVVSSIGLLGLALVGLGLFACGYRASSAPSRPPRAREYIPLPPRPPATAVRADEGGAPDAGVVNADSGDLTL